MYEQVIKEEHERVEKQKEQEALEENAIEELKKNWLKGGGKP